MIQSVLVANRGEIARRVFRTCRELGIATVAVYADADADAPHVREADAAVRLPGNSPADTYLRGDLIVKAALATGADAVHPGYGFLSENADFARAVIDAGPVWIGPPPEAIEAMASKTRAKEIMGAAGVPLLTSVAPDRAGEDDLPLLIKAAAGGGGRGMRVVRALGDLPAELAAASAEAASAFGDGEVFTEPYVERGRHVEVQILADGHGTIWALGTRDCSLQRRHQKVIEEAPAPGLSDALRSALHGAASEAARAIGYTGAGTVEFLVSRDGRPYFLEMNTRLQVEHPVTECVYGLDLVALQLRVAEGLPLPPEPPAPAGHAVEARLYAEDPSRDWQPQTGVLHRLDVPGVSPTHPPFSVGGGPLHAPVERQAPPPRDGLGPWAASSADAAGLRPTPQVAPAMGSSASADAGGPSPAEGSAAQDQASPAFEGRGWGGAEQNQAPPAIEEQGLGRSPSYGKGRGRGEKPAAGATAGQAEAGRSTGGADSGAPRAGAYAVPRSYPAGGDAGVRVDSGYGGGDVIGVHYDPMLAKVIAWAPTRAEAVRRLAHALERTRLHGPVTNRDLLVRSLRHPDFAAARLDTGFYDRNLGELTTARDPEPQRLAALVVALAEAAARAQDGPLVARLGGWRNVPSQPQSTSYRSEQDGTEHEVRYRLTRDGLVAADHPGVRLLDARPDRVVLEVDGVRRAFAVSAYGTRAYVDSPLGAYAFTELPRFPDPSAHTAPGSLLAPMPGTVVRVAEGLGVGDRVDAGQPLLWLEAMKMEHKIAAPTSGTLTALHAVPGQQVEVGALLAVVAEQ